MIKASLTKFNSFIIWVVHENLIKTLTKKGYNPSKLPLNDKGLTPVSFDNFSNRKDAVVALRKFQKSDNKDAWIFEIE